MSSYTVRSIDEEPIRETLQALKPIAQQQIRKLNEANRKKFQKLVGYVNEFYGTSSYDAFFEQVKEVFGDVSNPAPGTIGAYCVGCLTKSNFSGGTACSPVCAGSLPPPSDAEGWSKCDKHVVLVVKEGNLFTFQSLNYTNDRKTSFLFMDHHSINSFRGFGKADISTLQSMGIDNAMLISYSPEGKYVNNTDGFVPVTELSTRNYRNTVRNATMSGSDPVGDTTGAAILILFLLFLLVVFFIGWRMYSSKGRRIR